MVSHLLLTIADLTPFLNMQSCNVPSKLRKAWKASAKTTTSISKNQMKSRRLLNVVVGQGTRRVLELLSCKNEALLVGRDTFLDVNLCLDVTDFVERIDIECYSCASEGLYKDHPWLALGNWQLGLGNRRLGLGHRRLDLGNRPSVKETRTH